jgi:hypothetical protein
LDDVEIKQILWYNYQSSEETLEWQSQKVLVLAHTCLENQNALVKGAVKTQILPHRREMGVKNAIVDREDRKNLSLGAFLAPFFVSDGIATP